MNKRITAVFFTFYLLLLTWVILFKANPGSFDILFDGTFRSISLVPLFNAKETVLNAAVFVPLGVFVHLLFGRIGFAHGILLIASVSLFYEAMQYVLCVGTTDITDLISNTLGGAFGLLLCSAADRLLGAKAHRLLSMLSCASSVLLALLTRLVL